MDTAITDSDGLAYDSITSGAESKSSLAGVAIPAVYRRRPASTSAGRPSLTPTDLKGQPFIQLPARSHLRPQVDAALSGLGVRDWPVAITSDDMAMIVENLQGGTSFACLFARGADVMVAEGKLERLQLSAALPSLDVRYAVPPLRHGNPLVADLIAHLPS